jgi:hypothetical protein
MSSSEAGGGVRGRRAVEAVGRRCRGSSGATGAAAEELHAFGHDLDDGAFLPVLRRPFLELQAAFNQERRALLQVFAAGFGRLAPDLDADVGDFLFPLAAGGLVLAVGRKTKVGDGLSGRHETQFGVLGQVADQQDLVQAGHACPLGFKIRPRPRRCRASSWGWAGIPAVSAGSGI